MSTASRRRGERLFRVAVRRAMSDARYEKLLDECWEEMPEVFEAPKVREARRKYLRALAEEIARGDKAESA